MLDPKVSVIIPNFNSGADAINAVESVLSQDYPYRQIVMVDDCSTDDSVKIIAKHFAMDPPAPDDISHSTVGDTLILFKRNPKNLGRAGARNVGIKLMADSQVFAFLDADDRYLGQKLSKSVEKFCEDPNSIGVVYSDYISLNRETGQGVVEMRPPFDMFEMRQACQINNDSLVSGNALRQVGIYDESMEVAEDFDLWLRVTSRFPAIHIPEILLEVGVSSSNASKSVAPYVWQKNWALISQRMQQGVY